MASIAMGYRFGSKAAKASGAAASGVAGLAAMLLLAPSTVLGSDAPRVRSSSMESHSASLALEAFCIEMRQRQRLKDASVLLAFGDPQPIRLSLPPHDYDGAYSAALLEVRLHREIHLEPNLGKLPIGSFVSFEGRMRAAYDARIVDVIKVGDRGSGNSGFMILTEASSYPPEEDVEKFISERMAVVRAQIRDTPRFRNLEVSLDEISKGPILTDSCR
ncbi:MAG TPA: hypothetical protein VEB20_24220 [Azospirillaceae bacterium]|nr:hypothetical protein [Azospirillaceae bacterium]